MFAWRAARKKISYFARLPLQRLGTKGLWRSLIRLPDNDIADCVLFLKNTQTIHLYGTVSIRKVVGSLSIYGHDLDDQQWHSVCVYSPNIVTLQCHTSSFDWKKASLSTLLEDIYTNDNSVVIKKKKLNDVGCLLLLKSTCVTTDCMYDISDVLDESKIEKSQKELHEKTSDLNFTVFSEVPSTLSPIVESSDWPDISTFVEPQSTGKGFPVILVCGGKGVGKSTFGRYVINKLLNTVDSLCFLETDVGQSEFTPPALLALNVIDKPVFGPPFSHLSRPEKAYFFGDVSPKDRPSSYVRFIYKLYQFYKDNHDGTPLMVNTHGWVKGMGVRIFLDIIRIVQPTHVIQINSESEPTKNLPKLDNEFLTNEAGWNFWADDERHLRTGWKCSHIYQINAFKPNLDLTKRVSPHSSELRSKSLISYFGSFERSSNVTPSYIMNHCPVYSQPIKHLKFYNVYDNVSPSQILYSINGSIVGLLKVDDKLDNSNSSDSRLINDVPDGEYIGLGIVRNIDPKAGVLYIMTPEPPEKVCHVNALVKGRLEIPDILLKKRKFELTPYVTSEFTYKHKGSRQKKMRYNLLRQKSKSPRLTDTT